MQTYFSRCIATPEIPLEDCYVTALSNVSDGFDTNSKVINFKKDAIEKIVKT